MHFRGSVGEEKLLYMKSSSIQLLRERLSFKSVKRLRLPKGVLGNGSSRWLIDSVGLE